MAQYQVPQFIETEAKIVGPLTLKQFLYVAVAALISFFTFFLFQTFAWIVITAIVGTIAVALAFIKYNGRPLTVLLKSVFIYAWNPKLYLWKQGETALQQTPTVMTRKQPITPGSKIKDVWLKIHTAMSPRPEQKTPIIHGFHKESEGKTGYHALQKSNEGKNK